MNQSTDHLRTSRDSRTNRASNETYLESRLSEIQNLTLNQNEQLLQQQRQLDGLARGFLDIVQVLQQKGNPAKAIEENNQSLINMSSAILSLHKQLKEANFGQGFADIKSQQQLIGNAVATNRKSLESQANNLAHYFGWKRIVMIVVSTAVISSLFSVAIAALTPLAISQISGVNRPKSIEKVKPTVKKSKGG